MEEEEEREGGAELKALVLGEVWGARGGGAHRFSSSSSSSSLKRVNVSVDSAGSSAFDTERHGGL